MSFSYEKLHDNLDHEEEALSLCDLPICKTTQIHVENEEKQEENQASGDDFDFGFGFGSLIGSLSTLESEMCSADEVFSGGQILPFRHSVSSETSLSRSRNSSLNSISRSESMDRSGFCSRSSSTRSNSTRSNSIRSQYSTTSTNTSISNNSVKTIPIPKAKARNNFHWHPSPKPQVWASGARATTYTTPTSKKSTMWDVLRLGLVRAPEIELQDLKQRHRNSTSSKTFIMPRNNSSGSNSSSRSTSNNNVSPVFSSKISDLLLELQKRSHQPTSQSKSGGFFKSCKCSILAIEPIPRESGTKSGQFGTKVATYYDQNESFANRPAKFDCQAGRRSLGQDLPAVAVNCQISNEDKDVTQDDQKPEKRNKKLREGKKVMSNHRTFEWLRDLSQTSVLNP